MLETTVMVFDFNGQPIIDVRSFVMFRKTNPQTKLFGVDTEMSASSRKRLRATWAEIFKSEILTILIGSEDGFSILYGETGRPNFSVGRMLGLCLLQELNNFTDEEALDAFQFDKRWQHALAVGIEEDPYLSRRSLVEFRRRLALKDPAMELMRGIFERISNAAINKIGLSFSEQRVDSTHIASNIHTKSRLDLFQKTIKYFMKSLNKNQLARVPSRIKKWYKKEPDGWFGLGSASEKRQKLNQLSGYLHKLIITFAKDKNVAGSEEYQLLVRMFNEQCKLVKDESGTNDGKGPPASKGPDNESKDRCQVKIKKKSDGGSLDSPYDPDASYGHKGSGYSVHITETCNNKDKHEIITDYEVHGAARSDIAKASGVLDRLDVSGLKPETLFADGGYPSVPSNLEVFNRGVELVAPVNRSRMADEVMGRDSFQFDQDGFIETCPEGHSAIDHREISNSTKGVKVPHTIFDGDICRKCAKLEQCPVRAPNHRKRGCKPRETVGNFRLENTVALRLRDEMWLTQHKKDWKDRYKIRSGVEATQSELKRAHGLAKLRVRKAPKVIFAVACKVTACNIKRWAKALFDFWLPRDRGEALVAISKIWAIS